MSTDFAYAVEDLHERCRSACALDGRCSDRYAAAVASLICWIRDHPDAARIYWCEATPGPGAPPAQAHPAHARASLPTVVVKSLDRNGLTALHEVNIEYTIGVLGHIVDEELRNDCADLTQLEERLTELAPLLEVHER